MSARWSYWRGSINQVKASKMARRPHHQALTGCLRSHCAVLALCDQAWMPSPWAVMQRLDVVTGPFGYVRLLGDRAEVDRLTKTLDHIVIDRIDQIEADARAIKQLSGRVPVVTFVNHHFAGYGPETVRQLQAAIEGLT